MTESEKEVYEAEIKRLQTANQNKADLISISAHELRTSLSAVKWLLKMLVDGDFGTLSEGQHSLLERAILSNDRMVSLVNDVLTLNHTDNATIKYDFSELDLVSLVDEVIFDFRSEGFKRGVELVFIKPANQMIVFADQLKLRVVIQNLIENGIKYSEPGKRVSVALSADEKNATLLVKDGGIGIPESEQQNIFNKFFRATNAIKKEMVGSGLGLYTTKQIIEKHGGTIAFESKEGVGTTFTITIPLATSEKPAS